MSWGVITAEHSTDTALSFLWGVCARVFVWHLTLYLLFIESSFTSPWVLCFDIFACYKQWKNHFSEEFPFYFYDLGQFSCEQHNTAREDNYDAIKKHGIALAYRWNAFMYDLVGIILVFYSIASWVSISESLYISICGRTCSLFQSTQVTTYCLLPTFQIRSDTLLWPNTVSQHRLYVYRLCSYH